MSDWADDRQIHFYGQDFFNATHSYRFTAMVGDKPPTIVGGYAKWQVVDRPLQRGLTVFQGYDPISISVSLRFIRLDAHGGWKTDDSAGMTIEKEIEVLEWMAGESIGSGPSPLVWMTTYNSTGNTTPLIPYEYQTTTPNVPKIFGGGDDNPWIVTGLSWDENPIRNDGGLRIRQDATVTLQYYSTPGPFSLVAKARSKAITVVSRTGMDTAILMARTFPSPNPPALATRIVKYSRNKDLHLRSIHQKIKHGHKVHVPPGDV